MSFPSFFARSDYLRFGGEVFKKGLSYVTHGIDHRLAPPRHAQTNGMVERFNGRIADLIRQTRFAAAIELEITLSHYLAIDNHSIPQRALAHRSPVQALKQWRIKQPELFAKRVYKDSNSQFKI
jgi:transposase InsO family protein